MSEAENDPIVIRPARKQEREALAGLHFRAYHDRFFDPQSRDRQGKPYGAPLAREFPDLARGQNADYFRRYWAGFARGLDDPDPRRRNYCFVAAEAGGRQAIAAFIKGSGAPLKGEMRETFNRAVIAGKPDADECCELASIYCDPQSKYRGLGRSLVETFTRAMLDLGYRGMVTRAYDRNDSPAFFEKLGAQFMGACSIPNDYLTPEGKPATVDIPGVWLYWGREAMEKTAKAAPGS